MSDKTQVKKGMVREYFEAIIIALLLALVIRMFLIEPFKIPSGSMLETLQIGDQVLVTKFAYGVKIPFTDTYIIDGRDPEVGDVIVFPYPKNPEIDYIKRVVGVPGDIIEVRDKQLYRNGVAVEEGYIQHSSNRIEPRRDNMLPVTVPANKYFVMGDNRDDSLDSRFWGFVDRNTIHGKAWRLYWSWDSENSSVRFDRIGKKI